LPGLEADPARLIIDQDSVEERGYAADVDACAAEQPAWQPLRRSLRASLDGSPAFYETL